MSGKDFRINAAFGLRVQHLEKAITHASLTASAMSQAIDFDEALPAGALVLGAELDVAEAFSDGAAGTFEADLGFKTTDPDGLIDGADIDGGVGRLGTPQGTKHGGFWGGETPQVTVAGSVNVDTATAGEMTARVYFVDVDQRKTER